MCFTVKTFGSTKGNWSQGLLKIQTHSYDQLPATCTLLCIRLSFNLDFVLMATWDFEIILNNFQLDIQTLVLLVILAVQSVMKI